MPFSSTRKIAEAAIAAALWAAPNLSAQVTDLTVLRQRAKDIQSTMFGRECTPECIHPQIGELKKLVRDYSLQKLNQSNGDTEALMRDLLTIDNAWLLDWTNKRPTRENGVPPFTFRRKNPGGELIVTVNSFATGATALPQDAVIIQGFRTENGQYFFADETGDSLFGISWVYHPAEMLQSPVPDEVWFIIGGQVSGVMGHLDRVRVFSFDGHRFQERWAPEDREAMEITVSNDEIRATYLGPKVEPPGGRGFPHQDHMEEKLHLSVTGVEQISLWNHHDTVPQRR